MSAAGVSTAQAVVDRLEAHGVRHVFGIPGTHNLPLYHCLAESSIEHVTPRHEQAAGYAADGYARSGGGPGVCLTTSGPGVLNLSAAAATSYADSIPVLIVAPGMSEAVAGHDTGYLHEARDQCGAMARIVASATRAGGPAQVGEAIDAAFDSFARRRPRPAYIELPLDAIEARGEPAGELAACASMPDVDLRAVRRAARTLVAARTCAVILGGGCVGAAAEARALAHSLRAPVITTVNGKGTVPESDPLSLGASIRLPSARELLARCDVVLAVGTELGQSDLWRDPPLELVGELIRVDVDPDQLQKNVPASVAVAGDARAALGALVAELDGMPARDRGARDASGLRARLAAEALRDGAPFEPLMRALRRGLDPDAIVAGDSTMACYYGAVHLLPREGPRQFLYPTGFATLGYGLPAGIGAKLAHPNRQVVVLIGDGGIMFTLAELACAMELSLPLPIVVVNDGGYGEIRRQMGERGQPPIGVDLRAPDFIGLARSFGADAATVAGVGELPRLLAAAFRRDRPTLLEVRP